MNGHRTVFTTDRPLIHRELALEAAPPRLDIEMLVSPDRATLIAALAGAEFLISERAGLIDAEVVAAGRELRLIQRLGSRVHDIDLDAARESGVPVCTWPLAQSTMVAEHAMALILALVKRLGESMAVMTGEVDGDRDWGEPRECDAVTFAINWSGRTGITMLTDTTVGIVAMGEIGTELARRLRAFGCRVLYHNRNRLPEWAEERLGVRYRTRDELLGESDVVCLLLPHSEESTGLTDAGFLARMRPGAMLVSCGASTTLDEDAVADALGSGHLAGVATDGHRWEPPRPDAPLVALARDPRANVVLTPHTAQGDIRLTAELRAPEFSNLVALLDGRPLRHRVV